MKRDEVIALARDCPYTSDELRGAYYEGFLKGVAAEREECAKLCEAEGKLMSAHKYMGAQMCAAAIRSRT